MKWCHFQNLHFSSASKKADVGDICCQFPMLKRVNFLRVRCKYCKTIWVVLRVRAYCSPIFGFRKLSRRQLSPQTWYDSMIARVLCLWNCMRVFVSRINPLFHFGPATEEIPGAARKIGHTICPSWELLIFVMAIPGNCCDWLHLKVTRAAKLMSSLRCLGPMCSSLQ